MSSLGDARKHNEIAPWIGEEVWDGLCTRWRSSEFQEKSTETKRDRALEYGCYGSTKHTCGSIIGSQHKQNIVKNYLNFFKSLLLMLLNFLIILISNYYFEGD